MSFPEDRFQDQSKDQPEDNSEEQSEGQSEGQSEKKFEGQSFIHAADRPDPEGERPAPAHADLAVYGAVYDPSPSVAATLPPLPEIPPIAAVADPAWNGWDMVRLTCITIVALVVGVLVVLLVARATLFPHQPLKEILQNPLVAVAGQSVAYLIVLGYMYVLVTRERRRPDFLTAIHWNWPPKIAIYVVVGFVLSLALQGLAHFLPIPKELPIDSFFQTPAEAWSLGLLSITLAPLMEELYFRGFLYPVLARRLGLPLSVFITALAFALLHGGQLMFSWGAVLVIFLVGLVLTIVRARTNSVAAGMVIHMAYNATITIAMFAATDGFRHLERLNQ